MLLGRVLVLATAFAAGSAIAQALSDFKREKRWADEFVPSLVVGDAVRLRTGDGIEFLAIYTHVVPAKAAVLLAHGPGLHPDHGLTGELRISLADRGYATLSLQMPVLAADVEDSAGYAKLFPEATRRIATGMQFLRDKGADRIILVSHAMGSAMAHDYLRRGPAAPVLAWAALSFYGEFRDMEGNFPILDAYGAADYRGIRGPAAERARFLQARPGSKQVAVPDGGYFLAGGEKTVLREVGAFLDAVTR